MEHKSSEQLVKKKKRLDSEAIFLIAMVIFVVAMGAYLNGRVFCGTKKIVVPLPFDYEFRMDIPTRSVKNGECPKSASK